MSNYISVQEISQIIGTSDEFVRVAIREGRLKAERDPANPYGPFRIPRDDFERWYTEWRSQFEFREVAMPTFPTEEQSLIDLGWFAGVLDGEGYIGIVRQRWKKQWGDKTGFYVGAQPLVQVIMTDEQCVRRCQTIAGCGDIRYQPRTNDPRAKKPAWCWRVANNDAAVVLRTILPYLIGKRRQAELVLEVAHLNWCYRHGLRGPGGGRRAEDLEKLHRIADELFSLQGRRALRIS